MARRSSSPSPPSLTAAAPGWGKPAKIAVGSADQAQSGDAPGSSMVGQTPPRFSRMATQPDAVQAHPASVSAKPHRPVCDTNQRSTGAIRLLASRAVSRGYRRFRARLAQSRRLCLSTFLASESRDQSSASTERTLVLVTPLWRGATWFPQLLEVAVAPPVLLPQWPDLLLNQLGQSHPLVERRQLVLAVWLISGQPTRQRNFLRQCPSFCWHHGEREPESITTALGDCGIAGVNHGKSILLARLSRRS